jgi:beta-lactam-binding protein with PASTA domain
MDGGLLMVGRRASRVRASRRFVAAALLLGLGPVAFPAGRGGLAVAAPEVVSVPEVVDLPEAEARAMLGRAGFQVAVQDAPGDPAGTVATQQPGGFWWAARGSTVTIGVRRGSGAGVRIGPAPRPEGPVPVPPGPLPRGPVTPDSGPTVVVPSVLGLDADSATQQVQTAGLVPLVNVVSSDPANADKVIGQEPAAGAVVARNSNVTVLVGRRGAGSLLENEVPDLVRLSEGDARRALEQAGYGVLVKDRLAAEAVGLVVDQEPRAGSRLLRGRAVTIVVGRLLLLPIRVPETVGLDAATAEQALRASGFAVEQSYAVSLPGSAGRVLSQDPAGSTLANRGSTVRLMVGRPTGAASVPVPALVGRTADQARADLAAVGLVARPREVPPAAGEPPGRVRGQSPAAGTAVPRGSEVAIDVAGGPPPVQTFPLPGYVGMDLPAAQADLQTRGLRVVVTLARGTVEGKVLSQTPVADSAVVAGTQVTLVVSHVPTLGAVTLLDPASGTSLPKNYGVTFTWSPVPDAEDYEFEIMVNKDEVWVVADHDMVRATFKRPHSTKKGFYQWHVRARAEGGNVVGPWSEWRRLNIR